MQTLSGEFVRVSHIPPTEEKDNLKFPSKCCNRQNSIYNNNSKNQQVMSRHDNAGSCKILQGSKEAKCKSFLPFNVFGIGPGSEFFNPSALVDNVRSSKWRKYEGKCKKSKRNGEKENMWKVFEMEMFSYDCCPHLGHALNCSNWILANLHQNSSAAIDVVCSAGGSSSTQWV